MTGRAAVAPLRPGRAGSEWAVAEVRSAFEARAAAPRLVGRGRRRRAGRQHGTERRRQHQRGDQCSDQARRAGEHPRTLPGGRRCRKASPHPVSPALSQISVRLPGATEWYVSVVTRRSCRRNPWVNVPDKRPVRTVPSSGAPMRVTGSCCFGETTTGPGPDDAGG